MVSSLLAGVRKGEIRAISRAISLLESGSPEKDALVAMVETCSHSATLIGITGYPGAGKSTLIDQLIPVYRAQGRKVGVLAVDISSSVTGGAILGDRVRMQKHALDEGVYIRSMGTRGHHGGLAGATKGAIRVLETAGFEVILVETIGMGQEEGQIARIVPTVVVVVTPGFGDEVQAMKAGILETAHIVVVNKADHPGANETLQSLREWIPQVFPVIAIQGEGILPLIEAIENHQATHAVDSPVPG